MKGIAFRFQKRIAASQVEILFEGLSPSRRPPQSPQTLAQWQKVATAWCRGRLVGVATADGEKTVTLGWLYVHESYRRRGIGKKLVSMLLEKFPNAERAKLVANRGVLDFYRACGFQVRKDAVPMVKELKRGISKQNT